jgi:hypothetical protein
MRLTTKLGSDAIQETHLTAKENTALSCITLKDEDSDRPYEPLTLSITLCGFLWGEEPRVTNIPKQEK